MNKTRRTFIAVNVPVDENIINTVSYLKKSLHHEKIRWVSPDNLHITLRFLGDTHQEKIEKVSEQLEELGADHNAFEMSVKGLGVFRSVTYPRVLWLGLNHIESLKNIKIDLDQRLNRIFGENKHKKFSPHLTLGRMKRIEDRKRLTDLISEFSGREISSFKINKMIFYESVLSSKGAVYEPVSIHPLK